MRSQIILILAAISMTACLGPGVSDGSGSDSESGSWIGRCNQPAVDQCDDYYGTRSASNLEDLCEATSGTFSASTECALDTSCGNCTHEVDSDLTVIYRYYGTAGAEAGLEAGCSGTWTDNPSVTCTD